MDCTRRTGLWIWGMGMLTAFALAYGCASAPPARGGDVSAAGDTTPGRDILQNVAGRRSPAGARPLQIVALRPGRTVLRISNLHSARDTATSEPPVSSTVEQEIVVTAPIAAVRICPRLTRVVADTSMVLHVEAIDRAGNVLLDPPAFLRLDEEIARYRPGDAIPIVTRGPHSISVAFAGRADTLRLQAVARTRGPANPPLPRSEGDCAPGAFRPVRPGVEHP